MTMDGIIVANAPVSYGAFELTVGIDPRTPTGTDVLDEVAAAGYAGIDLGPVAFLAGGGDLRDRLAERNLGLAGGYLELPYADPAALAALIPALDALLDEIAAASGVGGSPPAHPTLADAGSEHRRAHPGQSVMNHSLGHDGWRRFGIGLREVVARCRDRGLEPTFHPETGTYVEAPWEIEKVLEVSDIGLCLDTGHLLLDGGDPVTALRDWGARINQVHLKDAKRSVMAGIVSDGAIVTEIWEREAFPALGAGDLDVRGVVDGLRTIDYRGWLVIEQDTLPRTKARFDQAAADQRANREFLAGLGL